LFLKLFFWCLFSPAVNFFVWGVAKIERFWEKAKVFTGVGLVLCVTQVLLPQWYQCLDLAEWGTSGDFFAIAAK